MDGKPNYRNKAVYSNFFRVVRTRRNKYRGLEHISTVIIQQIVTLSKYGHDALDIRHP